MDGCSSTPEFGSRASRRGRAHVRGVLRRLRLPSPNRILAGELYRGAFERGECTLPMLAVRVSRHSCGQVEMGSSCSRPNRSSWPCFMTCGKALHLMGCLRGSAAASWRSGCLDTAPTRAPMLQLLLEGAIASGPGTRRARPVRAGSVTKARDVRDEDVLAVEISQALMVEKPSDLMAEQGEGLENLRRGRDPRNVQRSQRPHGGAS